MAKFLHFTFLLTLTAAFAASAADVVCLTGNGPPPGKNAVLKEGCYQIVWTGSTEPKHAADVRYRGWLSFREGALTNGHPESMNYDNAFTHNVLDAYCWGPDDYTVDVDLGRVCEITRIKLDANNKWGTLRAFYPKYQRWLAVGTGRPTIDVKGLRCQRLRLDIGGCDGQAIFFQMYIWGIPLEAGAEETRPEPIAPSEKTVPYSPIQLKPAPVQAEAPDPFILPMPQEMSFSQERVKFPRKTTLTVAEGAPKSVEEIGGTFADLLSQLVDIELVPGKPGDGPAICIGMPAQGGKWADLATRRKITPADIKPEGYALEINRDGAVLTGVDEEGLLNATRSLVLLARPEPGGGISLPVGYVRDFPREPLRGIFAHEGWQSPFKAKCLTALSLFKNNTLEGGASPRIREIARRNHIPETIGVALFPFSMCGCGGDMLEMLPGFKRLNMNLRRLSACCSHTNFWPGMYRAFPSKPSDPPGLIANVCYDEMFHNPWMVCPRCRARGLTEREMILDSFLKAYNYLTPLGYRVGAYATGMVPGFAPFDMFLDIPVKDTVVYNYNRPEQNRILKNRGLMTVAVGGRAMEIAADPPMNVGMIQFWFAENRTNMISSGLPAQVMQSEENWALAGKEAFQSPAWYARQNRAMKVVRAIIDETPLADSSEHHDYFTIDLASRANRSLREEAWLQGQGWLGEGPARDLRHLPAGRQEFKGIPYQIADGEMAAIVVAGPGAVDRCYPDQVLGIPVGRPAGRLVFLQTCGRSVWTNLQRTVVLLGFYRVRYSDDTFVTVPVNYGQHVLEWRHDFGYRKMEVEPTNPPVGDAEVAWRGGTDAGDDVTLYAMPWANPYPEKTIASIDVLASAQLESNSNQLCLLAVSGSPPTEAELRLAARRTSRPELRAYRPRPELPSGVITLDLTRRTMHPQPVYRDAQGALDWKTEDGWVEATVTRAVAQRGEISFGAYSALDPDDDPWRCNEQPFTGEEKDKPADLTVKFKRLVPLRAIGVKGIMQSVGTPGLFPADFEVFLLDENLDARKVAEVKGHVGQEGEERWVLPNDTPVGGVRVHLTRGQGLAGIYLYGRPGTMDEVRASTAPQAEDMFQKKKVTQEDAKDELEGL